MLLSTLGGAIGSFWGFWDSKFPDFQGPKSAKAWAWARRMQDQLAVSSRAAFQLSSFQPFLQHHPLVFQQQGQLDFLVQVLLPIAPPRVDKQLGGIILELHFGRSSTPSTQQKKRAFHRFRRGTFRGRLFQYDPILNGQLIIFSEDSDSGK